MNEQCLCVLDRKKDDEVAMNMNVIATPHPTPPHPAPPRPTLPTPSHPTGT